MRGKAKTTTTIPEITVTSLANEKEIKNSLEINREKKNPSFIAVKHVSFL
jgi:hypothetical protein